MAANSFNSLYRSIKKGDLEPVYYLTGSEDVLKSELVHLCVDVSLDPAARDFSFDQRSASELDAESFTALVDTPPLLAQRRVVWIKDLELCRKNSKPWKALLAYVQNPSPDTILFITQSGVEKTNKSLASQTTHASIDQLEPRRVIRWVADRASKIGVEIEAEAAEHLVNVVGPDLASLATELEKLAAASDGTPVTREEVEELVGVRRGETLVDWVSAVTERQFLKAIELVDIILPQSGVSGVRMVSSLGTTLIGMRIARDHLNRGSRPRAVRDRLLSEMRSSRPAGLANWTVEAEKWTRCAADWTLGELDAAIRLIFEADKSLKSSTLMADRDILDTMLLELSAVKEAA